MVCLVLAVGCRPESAPVATPSEDPASTAPWFSEVAAVSGIDFVHRAGATDDYLLPEIMGGGAGFLDYDADGFLDVYLVQSGRLDGPQDDRPGNRLYRNDGRGGFIDTTVAAGVGDEGYGMGCAAGDIDNDGDVDLYVTNLGPNVLYLNNGDGTFADVTETAGVGDSSWSTSAAFVDYDSDGDLDLFVTHYVAWSQAASFVGRNCYAVTGVRDYCSPQAYDAPTLDTLYRNRGDGTFENVSDSSGIRAKAGTGLGVVCTDLNGDGRVDIYVSNDQMPSFAWINRGDGTFAESAVMLGCAVDEMGKSQAGMGVDAADIDNDGDMDLWKVHLRRESHVLYLNRGEFFDEVTAGWGLAAPTRLFTGFGTAFLDFDSDGLLDVFVANGRVQLMTDLTAAGDGYAEPNQWFRQVRAGQFTDISGTAAPAPTLVETSRAAAFGDYDNDGDIDILVSNRNGPVRLLRNDAPRNGGFISFRVLDRAGRDAYGAVVRLTIGSGKRTAEVRAAYSYCATNDPRVHFGVGAATRVSEVEIRWPTGERTQHGPFDVNQFVTIRQAAEPTDIEAR